MKRFEDLSPAQQQEAVHRALVDIIEGLMSGDVSIQLSKPVHQRVLMINLERGRTTGDWKGFHRYVHKVGLFKREVDEMARQAAQRAYFTEASEYVIYGVAGEAFEHAG